MGANFSGTVLVVGVANQFSMSICEGLVKLGCVVKVKGKGWKKYLDNPAFSLPIERFKIASPKHFRDAPHNSYLLYIQPSGWEGSISVGEENIFEECLGLSRNDRVRSVYIFPFTQSTDEHERSLKKIYKIKKLKNTNTQIVFVGDVLIKEKNNKNILKSGSTFEILCRDYYPVRVKDLEKEIYKSLFPKKIISFQDYS